MEQDADAREHTQQNYSKKTSIYGMSPAPAKTQFAIEDAYGRGHWVLKFLD